MCVLKTQSQPRALLGQSEIYSRNSRNNYFDCCLDYYYFIGEEKAWLCLMRRQVGNTSWHCQPRKTHKHHTPGKFSPWKGKTQNLSTNCFPHISLKKSLQEVFWQLQILLRNQLMLCYGCLLFTNLATW